MFSISHPLHDVKSFSVRTNSQLSKYKLRALEWDQVDRYTIFFREVTLV